MIYRHWIFQLTIQILKVQVAAVQIVIYVSLVVMHVLLVNLVIMSFKDYVTLKTAKLTVRDLILVA